MRMPRGLERGFWWRSSAVVISSILSRLFRGSDHKVEWLIISFGGTLLFSVVYEQTSVISC